MSVTINECVFAPSTSNVSLNTSAVTGTTGVGVAGASIQLSGTVTVPGTYCVEVYDLGNLVESVAYTINVLHS